MALASTNKWIHLCSFFLTFTSWLYMLYTSVSHCFSHSNSLREREKERSVLGSLIVIQHEAPCWVEFSCAAVSWITRQPINSCFGSGDNPGLINLWQGLWCHIAKSMMTYLLLTPSLRAMGLAVNGKLLGGPRWLGDIGPALSNPMCIRPNAKLLEKCLTVSYTAAQTSTFAS